MIGARYIAPKNGQPLVNWTEANLGIGGGNLTQAIEKSVSLVNGKFVIADNPDAVVLNFASTTGLLTGSFKHPGLKRNVNFKGALIQWSEDPHQVFGWFLGTNQSGFIALTP
jgi:hypothetical protein